MKLADIITIGDEILTGDILDTNSKFLCERLTGLGVTVSKVTIIHDDVEIISQAVFNSLNSDVDYTIVSGGLGATPDDMTIEAVAKALKCELKKDPEVVEWIKKKMEYMAKLGFKGGITEEREKFAIIPEGFIPIYNKVGLAPALVSEHDESTLIILPGVPRELEPLFKEISEKYIKSEETIECEELKIFGLESDLANCFKEFNENFPDIRLGSYPTRGTVLVKLYLSGKDAEEVKGRLEEAKEYLLILLKDGE
ncbi:MAG: molybdopterin-binding protein [Halobacteriota archaeon]|nr:molybdopterin-binding protein [Halobacteriota archaeon]